MFGNISLYINYSLLRLFELEEERLFRLPHSQRNWFIANSSRGTECLLIVLQDFEGIAVYLSEVNRSFGEVKVAHGSRVKRHHHL